jgi:surface polysaccharide O-acyltransferase-like enzyme
MQLFYSYLYLSCMKVLDTKKRNQERKKWVLVFLICIGTAFFYSNQSSKNTIAYQLFNPFYAWSNGEGNPIRNIVTKFIPQEIPDRLKEWN